MYDGFLMPRVAQSPRGGRCSKPCNRSRGHWLRRGRSFPGRSEEQLVGPAWLGPVLQDRIRPSRHVFLHLPEQDDVQRSLSSGMSPMQPESLLCLQF